ncbi:MAG: replication associated protein [Wigfec virus K19_593]|nr:MAG: replication associated protein [Wigfec virus K19_593]
MKTQSAQKCPEGNISNTSGQIQKKTYRSRCFVVTFWCKDEPIFTNKMAYLAYTAEVCPTTNRHHWQAFLYSKEKMTEGGLAKHLKTDSSYGLDTKVEFMDGSFESNAKYCSKMHEGKLIEHGRKPSQGERMDLDRIKKTIINGKSVDDITMEDPYLHHKYGRTMEKIEDIVMRKRKRTEMTKGIWFWGSTGRGKSHRTFTPHMDEDFYLYKNDKGWWDGYNGQDLVIINEFRGSIPFAEMLELCDKWPYKVSRRGREPMPFTSKKIIVNSSMHPKDIYPNLLNESFLQLERRFEIINIGANDWSQFTEEELDIYRGINN